MYFGLDIFTEAVGDVYIVWKFGVGGPRIGDDINEKRKPDLASRKKCMHSNALPYTRPTAKNTIDGVEKKLLYKMSPHTVLELTDTEPELQYPVFA